MALDKHSNSSTLEHGLLEIANTGQRDIMSLETYSDRIAIPTKRELGDYFAADQAAFIGSVLARREIQSGVDTGYIWGETATNYLTGTDEIPLDIEFYTGYLCDRKTRASHILQHLAFRDYLVRQPQIVYDETQDRYMPRLQTADIALYRVEGRHDLRGVAHAVSYVSSTTKFDKDLALLNQDDLKVNKAKYLIAGA